MNAGETHRLLCMFFGPAGSRSKDPLCRERRHNIVTADREPTVTLSQDPAKHTTERLTTEWV